jgi:hypothetical protein
VDAFIEKGAALPLLLQAMRGNLFEYQN